MKTVLIILVFFFAIVALFEVYSNDRFANGEGVSIGEGQIDVSTMDPNTHIPCLSWGVGATFERECFDPNGFNNVQIGIIPAGRIGDFIYPSEYISPKDEYSGSPLEISVLIAIAFLALGFIAGLLGAGQLANVVAAVGIALAVYNYINSILASQFAGLPFVITALINGIVGVFFIYLFIKLLRG